MSVTKFGRYEVQEEIGRGAMGKVYRAYDPFTQRVVAIKALKDDIISQDDSGEYRKRFQREARAAGGLSHPNIITIFDVGENYFVMEFLEGKSLLEILAEKGPMPLEEALPYVAPIADALAYAHGKGVYHRDIKPANIMIDPDGRPIITDFGLAHLESTVMTTAGQFLGSPSYMAPEQVLGAEITSRADLYSLSVVTYELLTGNKPFPGENVTSVIYKVVHTPPVSPIQFKPDLPSEYADIFLRALAKEPHNRFDSFSSFVSALNLEEFDRLDSSPSGEATIVSTRAPDEAHSEEQETVDLVISDVERAAGIKKLSGSSPSVESQSSITERGRPTRKKRNVWVAGVVGFALLAAMVLSSLLSEPVAKDIVMSTDPDSAEVWLDDELVGTSPVELASLAYGTHRVRIEKEGFLPLDQEFELSEDAPPEPLFFALQPARITLFLESEPAGASVSIDGNEVGMTPLEEVELEPGQHDVEVSRRGYETWRSVVVAQAGETVDVVARLRARARRAASAPKPAQPAEAAETGPDPVASAEDAELALVPEPSAPELPQPGELIELGPDDKPPKRISGTAPAYPPLAQKLNQQGRVTIAFVLTEEGIPTELAVIEPASPVLDQAVLDSVATWRYEPAERQGIKVRVEMRVRQTFRLGRQ